MKLVPLLVGGAAYEEVAAELRERDRLEAHRLREETAPSAQADQAVRRPADAAVVSFASSPSAP